MGAKENSNEDSLNDRGTALQKIKKKPYTNPWDIGTGVTTYISMEDQDKQRRNSSDSRSASPKQVVKRGLGKKKENG